MKNPFIILFTFVPVILCFGVGEAVAAIPHVDAMEKCQKNVRDNHIYDTYYFNLINRKIEIRKSMKIREVKIVTEKDRLAENLSINKYVRYCVTDQIYIQVSQFIAGKVHNETPLTNADIMALTSATQELVLIKIRQDLLPKLTPLIKSELIPKISQGMHQFRQANVHLYKIVHNIANISYILNNFFNKFGRAAKWLPNVPTPPW